MTEGRGAVAPGWMVSLRDRGGPHEGPEGAELCRAALIEIFAYMGMDLDERGRGRLESYGPEQIHELLSKIKGLLQ